MITPLYASLLALGYVYLSLRVIKNRRKLKVSLGDGNHPDMLRAIRVHANFAEYVPFSLILIFFVENQRAPLIFVHVLALTLILARILHAIGIKDAKTDFRFRVGGMMLTFSVLITSSLFLIYRALPI